jgi:hypothetical protein
VSLTFLVVNIHAERERSCSPVEIGEAFDFVPENDLEAAMLAALVDPARMAAFHDALAQGTLLIPLRPAGGDEPTPLDLRGPLRFTRITYKGSRGVPAFTSVTQMTRVALPHSTFAEMSGRLLAAGWDETTTLLVNPGGDLGLRIAADVIRSWRPKD